MIRYVAFLRGINISGKKKISMSDLKTEFEMLGFCDVKTYLNSGNVVFSSAHDNCRSLIEDMIIDKFGFKICVYVVEKNVLNDVIMHAPEWWNTKAKDRYDNLIFILSSDSPEQIKELVGEPTDNLERIEIYQNYIFWTFDREKYQKCNWWKRTASDKIADKLTIRTANTIIRMCQ